MKNVRSSCLILFCWMVLVISFACSSQVQQWPDELHEPATEESSSVEKSEAWSSDSFETHKTTETHTPDASQTEKQPSPTEHPQDNETIPDISSQETLQTPETFRSENPPSNEQENFLEQPPPPNVENSHRLAIINRCSFAILFSVARHNKTLIMAQSVHPLVLPPTFGSSRLWAVACTQQGQCADHFPGVRTLFEFNFTADADWINGSLVDGFNLPMLVVAREKQGQTRRCNMPNHQIRCTADLLSICQQDSQCRAYLRTRDTDRVVENADRDQKDTITQKLFLQHCPDFYTFSWDDRNPDRKGPPVIPGPMFWCPAGTDFDIVFCP